MTFLFKIRIYDRHEIQDETEDGEERVKKKEDKWYKFDLYIEVGKLLIKDFREYILWEDDNETPIKCVKIIFTDDTYVYGAYAIIDTFIKEYEEKYKPMYKKWFDIFHAPFGTPEIGNLPDVAPTVVDGNQPIEVNPKNEGEESNEAEEDDDPD